MEPIEVNLTHPRPPPSHATEIIRDHWNWYSVHYKYSPFSKVLLAGNGTPTFVWKEGFDKCSSGFRRYWEEKRDTLLKTNLGQAVVIDGDKITLFEDGFEATTYADEQNRNKIARNEEPTADLFFIGHEMKRDFFDLF